MTNFSTSGGVVTRGETFAKLLFHLREAQDQAAVMAHLENTESGPHAAASAKGWLMVSEMMRRIVKQVTDMARSGLQ